MRFLMIVAGCLFFASGILSAVEWRKDGQKSQLVKAVSAFLAVAAAACTPLHVTEWVSATLIWAAAVMLFYSVYLRRKSIAN